MAPPSGKRKFSSVQPPGPDAPALSTDVEAHQRQLRLSRLQCQDLHKQLLSTEVLNQADLAQRLAMAKAAYRTLRDEVRAQREAHREELEDLRVEHQREIRRLTEERDRAIRAKEIAETSAYSDKWSQGQAATELAHALTIHINDIRQKGGKP
jgi:hypothetical protein